MKFTVFKWWESWVKPIIYLLILVSTVGLIAGYFYIKDDGGTISFTASIVYALVLFLVTIPINKIDNYVAEKLYERESFYLNFSRLRDVTNNTIKNVERDDFESLKKNILAFQIFTGREANMVEEKLKGEKVHVYIKEKGFTYDLKMEELEMKFLKSYDNTKNKNEISKNAKKLCKYYQKSCRQLDSNYNRIAQIYGGALFDLIERDSIAADAEYSLSDIVTKMDELSMELSSLKSEVEELSGEINDNQRDVAKDHMQLAERLMDVEDAINELKL